jgi:PAS domain S-box-containing protein
MDEKPQAINDWEKDEKLSKISQQLISISQGTSTVIGERFFENLAQCLAAAFHVRYAFIGKIIDFEKNIAQMSPLWDDVEKKFNKSIIYDCKDTPCEGVVLKQTRLFSKNVQESYPLAPILKKYNIESYFGIPLISSTGKQIGIISVMDDKPMTDTEHYEPIIQIFADRCASEMERLELDAKLKEAAVSKKRSEDYLSTIANNTTSVIYMKDLEGRYLFMNKRWENIFNMIRQEALGKTDLELFPKEIAEKFIKNDQQVMQSGETFEGEEFAPHDDGLHTYISIKVPLKDSRDVVYGMCGVSTDITDRKKMEDKIKRSNEELEDFASIASHDLQEPLRKISLFSERLKILSPNLDEKSTNYLHKITNSAERMKNLMEDLLSYSKVSIKGQPFEQVELNLRGCTR